ncbi:MAG: DUF554 domain-containing protein, partial [Cyanobacteria bacterium P01_H01_bin.121]
MNLNFWTQTSGTWVNVLTVLGGTAAGLVLRDSLPTRIRNIIPQSVGLVTLLIGFTMGRELTVVSAGAVEGIILGLLALVIGGILGEWLNLEYQLERFGNQLKRSFQGDSEFTEGFVTASLLFCVGPLALIGGLNNGLQGDNKLLVIKAVMDGLAAIALTSSYGLGVGFSIVTILLYQGSISLAAGLLVQFIPDPAQNPAVLLMTGVGGLMIVGLGFNLLDIARIRVASLLPALLLAPILYQLALAIQGHG